MFEKGAMVLYGMSGIYRVEEIGPIEHIRGLDASKDYYKLVSVRNGAFSYVPVDTKAFMRAVLSEVEAMALLAEAKQLEPNICTRRDAYSMQKHYKEIFAQHDAKELFRMLVSIEKKVELGYYKTKKMSNTEYDFKKRAENLIVEELSVALNISLDEARQKLLQALK